MHTTRQGLSQTTVIVLVICALAGVFIIAFVLQALAEQGAFDFAQTSDLTTLKAENEIAKLSAEIRQIRSETSGSLFWLKVLAVFVTVGGAVGGYLVGQNRATKARIDFEDKKAIDAAYQAIVQELSASSPVSRAAAAVKLGQILKQFPAEWETGKNKQEIEKRKQYLVQLTKQVLAAALAIEGDSKVLKALTIALVSHQPWKSWQADAKPRLIAEVIPQPKDEEKARREAVAIVRPEVEKKTQPESETKAQRDAEEKAWREAVAKAWPEVEKQAQRESEVVPQPNVEEKAWREAAVKVRLELETNTQPEVEEKPWREAVAKAWREAVAIVRPEVEKKAQRESEAKAQLVAEAKVRLEHEVKADTKFKGKVVEEANKIAQRSDVRGLDLSLVKAADAYWAKANFSGADFYKANLKEVSFRKSVLDNAQFREAGAENSVFIEAECKGTNFKLADLRGANFKDATLVEVKFLQADLRGSNFDNAQLYQVDFEGAKVGNTSFTNAEYTGKLDTEVDSSASADGSRMVTIGDWLKDKGAKVPPPQ